MTQQENQPARSLTEHFKHHDPARQGSAWDALWEDQFTPWDRGGPSWALHDLLKERPELFDPPNTDGSGGGRRKTALVPGCGRGHDVLLLSEFGYDVCGLEISPRALEEAKRAAAEALREDAGTSARRGRVTFVSGDFFADDWLREAQAAGAVGDDGKFDLIFDYTFLCALHPSMRPRWAERMRDLLAPESRGGRLVCLEFPSRDPAETGPGPAWSLPPHVYVAHLSQPGAAVPTDENGAVPGDYVPQQKSDGLERLVHLKPRRTHPAGAKGGDVQDRISVWKHRASE
ncbi:hypothetical protein DL769_002961 [Monosporascus sp. CRB-8-3]|nr:hypothetical protein DL769_002961 [Monosporascus sp. CRB-8-3]